MSRVVGFLCAAVMFGLPVVGLAQEDGGVEVPAEWYCTASYYSDGDCDCGCGVIDPTCPAGEGCATAECDDPACDFCYDAQGDFITCGGSAETDAGSTGTDAGSTGTDAGSTGTDANTGGGGGSDDTSDDEDDSGMCSGVPAGNAAAVFGIGLVALLALRRRR